MRIHELIDEDTKRKLNVAVHRPEPEQAKRRKEKLSRTDLQYLMGVGRDRYRKVNGRVRRR